MKAPLLPVAVHVDPNMHPNLYKHLLTFAVVFDKVSLYCVSGQYLDALKPDTPTFGQFSELVSNPGTSPFLLTAPGDWYTKAIRDTRLNPLATEWHEYDNEIANNLARYGVVQVPREQSVQIRSSAMDEALRFQ